MNARTTKPGRSSRRVRTIAALAAVVVVGASGVPSALAGTSDPAVEDAAVEVAGAAVESDVDASEGSDVDAVVEVLQDEPVTDEPVTDESEEPVTEEPVTDEPAPEPVTEPEPTPDPVVAQEREPVARTVGTPAEAAPGTSDGPEVSEGEVAEGEVEAAEVPGDTVFDLTAERVGGDLLVTWGPGPSQPTTWDYHYHLYLSGTGGSYYGGEMHPTTSWTVPGVAPGTYTLSIDDDYDTQTIQVVVPDPVTAPSPPVVSGVLVEGRDATVSWSAPEVEGSSPVTGYEVTVDGTTTQVVVAGTLSATFAGLEPGSHSVAVVALSEGKDSEPATDVFEVRAAPDAPTQVGAAQAGTDGVDVTWSAPDYAGYPGLDGYSVWLAGDEGAAVAVTADQRSTSFTGVLPGDHTVHVAATSKYGDSESATATVSVYGLPSEPLGLTAVPAGDGTATVTWDEPTDLGNSQLQGYDVLLDGTLAQRVDASTRDVVLAGLAAGAHTVEVIVNTAYGHSSAASYDFEMPSLPTSPLRVQAEQTGPTSVLLTWEAPSNEGDSPIIGYRVTATPMLLLGHFDGDMAAGAAGEQSHDVPATARSHEFTGLLQNTRYIFTVAAITADGVGEPGSDDEQTEQWRAPSVPTAVSILQTGPGQVTVRFGEPEDEGTSPVVGYVLGLSGPDSGGYEELDADVREVVLDDLAPGLYSFRILAVNEQGAVGAPVDVDVLVEAEAVPPVDTPAETPTVSTPVVVNAPVRSGGTVPATVTYTSTAPATLARTGAQAGTVALGGLLLLLTGAGAIVAGRRRQVTNG